MKIQQLDSLHSFTDVTSHTRNDLVFEHRFKEYGAYEIRTNYAGTVLWAMLFTFGALVMVIVIPKIIAFNSVEDVIPPKIDDGKMIEIVTPVDITPKIEIPVQKITPVVAAMKTDKFTANIQVIDNKTTTDIKTQDNLLNTTVSNVTQDGIDANKTIVVDTDVITNQTTDMGTEYKPYLSVEEMPTFIGGEAALFKYLGESIVYPQMTKDMGVNGTVYVQFIVASDGSIQNAKVVRGVRGGKELEQEALRVVKNMQKWIPGKQNGVPVFVQFTLPIKFVLR